MSTSKNTAVLPQWAAPGRPAHASVRHAATAARTGQQYPRPSGRPSVPPAGPAAPAGAAAIPATTPAPPAGASASAPTVPATARPAPAQAPGRPRSHRTDDLVVTTDGLTKTYGDFHAVDHVDLRVPRGGIYGFLGPNGAGKSTTMKLLLGLTRPTSGTMSVLGHPVSPRSPLPAGAIGSLIEGPSYYPRLTGPENLAMVADYLSLPRVRVQHALATVALTGQDEKLVKDYSLGMKQRLGLAMALLADPPLMLLDEPTNGLDPAGVAEIRELIVALARQEGVTVIVSSHILSEIEQMADVVGIICAGSLRYQGPLSGLQDEGVIDFTVSDPAGAAALFDEQRIAHRVRGRTVRIPMLPDEAVGDLVTRIVRAGGTVFRVQTVRKTLEQAFLELTDPLGHQHRPGPAADAVPLTTGQGAQR